MWRHKRENPAGWWRRRGISIGGVGDRPNSGLGYLPLRGARILSAVPLDVKRDA